MAIKKKLMILGANEYMYGFISKATMLCEVILVAPDALPEIKRLPLKYYDIDISDIDKVLSVAIKEKIDGVTTEQAERPVRAVAYVAEELKLPGIGLECSRVLTNKAKMRTKLLHAGLPTVDFRVVKSLEEADRAFNEIGVPVIVKPVDSRGSRGVNYVADRNALLNAFESAKREALNSEVMIEEFVTGREIVCEALSLNGKCRTIAIGDSIPFGVPGVFSPCQRIFPSDIAASLRKKIEVVNNQNIEALGVKQGITHTEYIVNEQGIHFVESSARAGGIFLGSSISSEVSGIDVSKFIIQAALGELNELPSPKNTGIVCGYAAFYLPPGEIVSVDGLNEVKTKPYVHNHALASIKVGMQTKPIEDKTSRYCLTISAKNRKEYELKRQEIINSLNIRVKTESGIKGPIWE